MGCVRVFRGYNGRAETHLCPSQPGLLARCGQDHGAEKVRSFLYMCTVSTGSKVSVREKNWVKTRSKHGQMGLNCLREVGAEGSNPATPTNDPRPLGAFSFSSGNDIRDVLMGGVGFMCSTGSFNSGNHTFSHRPTAGVVSDTVPQGVTTTSDPGLNGAFPPKCPAFSAGRWKKSQHMRRFRRHPGRSRFSRRRHRPGSGPFFHLPRPAKGRLRPGEWAR